MHETNTADTASPTAAIRPRRARSPQMPNSGCIIEPNTPITAPITAIPAWSRSKLVRNVSTSGAKAVA